jgi:hypothetical protein
MRNKRSLKWFNFRKFLDLGQDYEHLELLISKYENLRKEVSGGKEKLESCLTLAQRLKNPDSDLEKLVQVSKL